MSQTAAETCVFQHMLAYYRYKAMCKIRVKPDQWLAHWGTDLPDDPCFEKPLKAFSLFYWEREEMSNLMEDFDSNRYDLTTAKNVWRLFQVDWKAGRVGDFSKYRAEFDDHLECLRIAQPGDRVYAKAQWSSGGNRITARDPEWSLVTVKKIDRSRIRIQIEQYNGPERTWMPMDREGRLYFKAYAEVPVDQPVHRPSQAQQVHLKEKTATLKLCFNELAGRATPREDPSQYELVAQAMRTGRRVLRDVRARAQWKINDRVHAQDSRGKWYEAVVREIRGTQILIHYVAWPDRYDEWIEYTSKRIEVIRESLDEAGTCVPDDPPEPEFESTLRRHVVADLAAFVEQHEIHCEDCKEPMTTQTFHLTRCFHMICKFCNHNRGERCFCGHPFATPITPIPKYFTDLLPHIAALAEWECVVCTELMTEERFNLLTPCFHKVCKDCVAKLINRRCPVCREAIKN